MFFVSLKNVFTSICLILTMCLIYQVLFTYVVEKPTSTSKEVRQLDVADLPEVVVCLDPGLNYTALAKYGYYSSYMMGANQKKFVGWNGGGEGESKSSKDILEEALLVPDFNKTRLITWVTYSENYDYGEIEHAEVTSSTGAPK